MLDASDQFTLHLSVAVRWWLYHLPQAPAAARFRDERLEPGLVTLLVPDTIEFQVVQAVVQDLGADLDVFLAQRLGADIVQFFAGLQRGQRLRKVPTRLLVRPALLATAVHHIAFSDAVAVTLAEASLSPLLVADEIAYRTLKALERVRANLRVAWLPDSMGS